MCGIAEIVMSANRISFFHLKVAFRIAIQMQSLFELILFNIEPHLDFYIGYYLGQLSSVTL